MSNTNNLIDNTYVILKYGKPEPTWEYILSLPEEVIEDVYQTLSKNRFRRSSIVTLTMKRQNILFAIRWKKDKQPLTSLISKSLINYEENINE